MLARLADEPLGSDSALAAGANDKLKTQLRAERSETGDTVPDRVRRIWLLMLRAKLESEPQSQPPP